MPENLWRDDDAAKQPALDGLVYRSRLLGAERSVVNIFGGNTSAKILERNHLGREANVLWVKGSGSDVADITEKGFAGLRLDEILPLFERQAMTDEEMVAYLERTVFEPGRPRQSIETLLHAFTPATHVDHTHPDAIISLACTPNGESLTSQLWGERAVWVDYTRPGFTLSKWIGEGIRAGARAELVVMGKHGLVTWGETSKACYESTIKVVQEAEEFIASRLRGRKVFTGTDVPQVPEAKRRECLLQVLPALRGAVSGEGRKVLQVDPSEEVIAFVCSAGARDLSQIGAACPDHLVHTKRLPLFVDWTPDESPASLARRLEQGVATFIEEYRAYFKDCSKPGDVLRDPSPRVVLVPGIGMITTGSDANSAEVSRQLYHRAIPVIEGSEVLGGFVSLSPQEAFDIEYWPLELYKLSLKPPPKELAGHVAVVTGGASGIGRATARRLALDGAHVAILDVDAGGAAAVARELTEAHGHCRGMAVACDVTDECAVREAFEEVTLAYGGVDVVVSNAGIAVSAPIDETELADWDRTMDVLAKGYFLVSKEAFKLWRQQGRGGSLIYVASKNSVAAGKNASAYSAAKAAELHLARCLAEEGGPYGIRVNTVLPDAVLEGSGIWDAGWREARARGYGIEPDQLDEFYRQRTTLKVNVYSENVAEAISFLAGPRASRTTGGVLTVDGGVSAAYVR